MWLFFIYCTIPPLLPEVIGLAIVEQTMAIQWPLPILLRKLWFCHSNVLSHPDCLDSGISKLFCTNTRINSIFGLFVLLSTMGPDFLIFSLCFFLYILILKTILSIASMVVTSKLLRPVLLTSVLSSSSLHPHDLSVYTALLWPLTFLTHLYDHAQNTFSYFTCDEPHFSYYENEAGTR